MTSADPFIEEEIAFDAHTAAEAQFWTTGPNNDRPGILVTLPRVGYEFSNDAYVGRDPGGMFSYNKLSDIPIDRPTKFKVLTRGSGRRVYVTVIFYEETRDGVTVYGRFVGTDPEQAAKSAGLVGKTGEGRWGQPGIGSTTAVFRKEKGSTKGQVIGLAAHISAEFALTGDAKFVEEVIDIRGELRYHDQDKVNRGHYVRWISDHLVFFEDDIRSHEYTAYFMAYDGEELTALMPAEHKDFTVRGVKWLDHGSQ